jgi:hypothetical protein
MAVIPILLLENNPGPELEFRDAAIKARSGNPRAEPGVRGGQPGETQ